jgi:kynurenine formamidase
MCLPACTKKISQDMSRRNFLRAAAGIAAVTATAGCVPISANPAARSVAALPAAALNLASGPLKIEQIVDLTYDLGTDFPTFSGSPQLEMEQMVTLAKDGYNVYRWLLVEHTGTHMDAPFHFSDGMTANEIPAADLVGPLVNVDIRQKAQENPDAQLTPDDLAAWEAANGPIPAGAIVAMNSGWQQHMGTPKFRNADDQGVMHFPGFHIEAIEKLLGEHNVKGIFVDTLSLDFGPSPDFAVHYRWLPAQKWGMENVANLEQLPASGALVVVGGPKIVGATGGPSRVFALL